VNVIGSVNVAEAVARQGTCGLAYISTSHVYAPSDEPLTESGATKPPSQYGLTKLQGENWILSIKPDALAIRVFSFFDPVQPASYLVPALTKRIRAAERGAVMPLRGALCKRDIADASWLAALCTALVTRNIKGIVNCGTGHGYLVREIAERLAAAMGRRDLSWQGFPEDGINALVADIQTLSAALGAPPAFDLDTSFADYVAALR
jgi:nucleoside-diphosphate-sugar epimerase